LDLSARDKLEKIAEIFSNDILKEKFYRTSNSMYYPQLEAKSKNLLLVTNLTLPEHTELFSDIYQRVKLVELTLVEGKSIIEHLLQLIEIERATDNKVKGMKIFEGAEEKLEQASTSFRNGDYPSTFHNLNTCLELVLKDKLGIPTTIKGINTSNTMDILTKYKIEPYLYLEEARKLILVIDNKIKHQVIPQQKLKALMALKQQRNCYRI
jgi:HEPN domain-containing protein